jgi:hypothetical protein
VRSGADLRLEDESTLYVGHGGVGVVGGSGTLVEGGVAKVRLDGRRPDARRYQTGIYVHDTGSSGDVYLVYDPSSRGGTLKLG